MMLRIRPALLALSMALAAAVPAQSAETVRAVPVTVTRVSAETLDVRTSVPGELESPAEPTVAAEVDGRVLSTRVLEGQSVDEGEVIAQLDAESYDVALERAKADIVRIEALIENYRRTLNRLQGLMERRSSAQSELDKAETDLATANADLVAAKAREREAQYNLAKTRVTSPIRGIVQARHVSSGDYVKKGDPLFKIVATENLSARLYFPESLAAQVRIGLPVTLKVGSGVSPLDATLTRLLPAADPGNRAVTGIVDFTNPGGWQPGLSVTGNILLESLPETHMVPVQSVVSRPAGMVVYRIDQNQAVAEPVKIGRRDGSRVEILSGLAADTVIALDGAGFLTDGASVEIRGGNL